MAFELTKTVNGIPFAKIGKRFLLYREKSVIECHAGQALVVIAVGSDNLFE